MQTESEKFSSNHSRQLATYVLAISIFTLSGALIYFAWQATYISHQLQNIAQSNNLKEIIPPILEEVSESRKLVTPVLDEVRLTREQIPEILNQLEQTRNALPEIKEITDNIRDSVVMISNELKATRPLVPDILDEVKNTREAIPPMLDRADKMISTARQAGKEASKGAVSGVLTGIITAPFEMIGSLGKKMFSLSAAEIKEMTERDIELTKTSIAKVLSSDKIGESSSWENPDNRTTGTLTLLKIDQKNDRLCKVINLKVRKNNRQFIDKDSTVCLNENDEWEQAE